LKLAIEEKNVFIYQLFPNVYTYISESYFQKSLYARAGHTCAIEKSFTENQKHQQATKSVCCVNTNTVNNASFT